MSAKASGASRLWAGLSLSVQDKVALDGWASRFDELGAEHSR